MNRSIAVALMAALGAWLCSTHRALADQIYNPDTLTAGSSPTAVSTFGDLSYVSSTPYLYGYMTPANDPAFNGHNYISYGGAGISAQGSALSTSALYTGNSSRTIVAVYDTPGYNPSAGYNYPTYPNGYESTAIGETGAGVGPGPPWFAIQNRDDNVIGAPYLVTAGADISSGNIPANGLLTFALATYDTSTSTETLYWAYGVNGAIQSSSNVVGGGLGSGGAFELGLGSPGDGPNFPINIGQALEYNSPMNSMSAMAQIAALQSYYAVTVPEPSSAVLCAIGGLAACMGLRRRAAKNRARRS